MLRHGLVIAAAVPLIGHSIAFDDLPLLATTAFAGRQVPGKQCHQPGITVGAGNTMLGSARDGLIADDRLHGHHFGLGHELGPEHRWCNTHQTAHPRQAHGARQDLRDLCYLGGGPHELSPSAFNIAASELLIPDSGMVMVTA